jgi:sialic acid synthase SpsE
VSVLVIGEHPISPHTRVFVIAEIGVNHDGRIERALELVRHAADAGADAVKLQLFRAAALMHPSAGFAEYQEDRCEDDSPAEMLRRYELSDTDLWRLVEYIRRHGLLPLATPFSPSEVELCRRFDLPAIKIASPDLVNRPLLERCTTLGRPLLVSTGAATMREVSQAVAWLRELDTPFALLHCVSSYPAEQRDANLCWIAELAAEFDVPVGYSDHTTEPLAGALAVAAGACIVEKHLTYDRFAPGPDHSASADPPGLAAYIRAIRIAEALRGAPGKRVLPAEEDVRTISRQSLVLVRPLSPGQALTADDLTVQRPGTGIPASELTQVVGRSLRRPAPAGTMLRWDMVA